MTAGTEAGVAFGAHIGGFLVGMLLVKLMQPPRRRVMQTWRA
jgi:membrane associated rhomboid family serine protease